MNPEIDLDDLDIKEEDEVLEPSVSQPEKIDFITEARDEVIEIIGQNVFDRDLEQALFSVVDNHFNALSKKPAYHADIFKIPDLNMEIWEAYHNYETFIYDNKFENIDLCEIAKIIREQVVPKVTNLLWEKTSQLSQQSSP